MTRRTRIKTLEGQRYCSKCSQILDIEQFHWRNKKLNTRRNICKNCRNQQKWFSSRVKSEHKELLEKQDGKCAICKVDHKQSQLAIDHDHKIYEIRGLICLDCNSGLANFDDNPDFLIRAVIYLKGGQDEKAFSLANNNPNYDLKYYGGVSKLRSQTGDLQGVPLLG